MTPRSTSAGRTSAAFARRPIDRRDALARPARHSASASSRLSVASSRYFVARRRAIRCGSTSTTSAAAPFIAAASGWAPPMPPSPAVTTSRPDERSAEMAAADRRQRFVSALHDALAADVDPAAGGHLSVHRQAAMLEIAEVFPRRPRRHEHRVRDEHARRAGMSLKNADRLAGLHEQRLVVLERRASERTMASNAGQFRAAFPDPP